MDVRYNQEVLKYGKKDAIIALCAWLAVCAITFGFWAIIENIELTRVQARIAQIALVAVVIGGTFAIVLARKQGLASIGFHKEKLWPMIRFGLILLLIILSFGLLPGLIYGWEFNSLGTIFYLLIFTIMLAAWEDIFYVGYLQTRLYGLFKKNIIAVLAGMVLFTLPHIPMGLAMMDNMAVGWGYMLIAWPVGHLLSVLIFRRYFSIFHVIIWHTFSNSLPNAEFWSVYNHDYNVSWAMTASLVIIIMLVVMEIISYRRSKKGAGSPTKPSHSE